MYSKFKGKDIGPHPELPGRSSAAPHPSREEILCNKNNPDLPDSFVEPSKKKAKRHLIHQKLDQEDQPEQVTVKEELVVKSEGEELLTDEPDELLESDEQNFEVMKDIYYKAGEMESDGLEEWADESKRKGKKPAKKSKSKSISGNSGNSNSSTDSQPLSVKQRRTKSETVHQTPSSLQTSAVESTNSASSTGTPCKSAPVCRLPSMFNGFRIPKKIPTTPAPESDYSAWTEAEHNASQILTSLAGYARQETSANSYLSTPIKRQSDQADLGKEFSKTRIQTPSPNSHIKSCPIVSQPCPSPSSLLQHGSTLSSGTFSAKNLVTEGNFNSSETQITSSKPLFQQQLTPTKNKPSGSDERRSRKQKCPRSNRSGLDARDLSANL